MQLHIHHHALLRPTHVVYVAPSTNPTLVSTKGIAFRTQPASQCRPNLKCKTSATDSGAFVPVEWESDAEVHDEESLQRKAVLIERFKAADTDGYGSGHTEAHTSYCAPHSNGVIDREELRALLEATDGGQQRGDSSHWMSDDEVDRVMRQYSGDAGVLTFDQFAKLVRRCDEVWLVQHNNTCRTDCRWRAAGGQAGGVPHRIQRSGQRRQWHDQRDGDCTAL